MEQLDDEIFKEIVEFAGDYIALLDINGNIVYCNESSIKSSGFERDEIIGHNRFEQIHPEDKEKIMDIFKSGLESGLGIGEYRIKEKNGTWKWLESRGKLLKDLNGNLKYILVISRDVTHRKEVEIALKRERDRFEKYVNLAEGVLVTLDKNGNIVFLNRKALEILEYERTELIGKNWFDHCLPKHIVNEVRKVFQKIINGNLEPVKLYENPILTRSGEEKIIVWHNTMIRDDDGKIIGTLGCGNDITYQKQLQEKIEQNKKLVLIGELTAGIAHQLNTPLANIHLTLHLLLTTISEKWNSVTQEFLLNKINRLIGQSDLSNRIVRDLLHFSREPKIVIHPISVNEIIESVLEMPVILFEVNGRAIEIKKEYCPACFVSVDIQLMTQAFQNIIENAIHAVHQKIFPLILIQTSVTSENVVVKIIDNGNGIDKLILNKIFIPFFSTKRVGEGTGLGLPICKNIIEKHNGKIEIESTPQVGTNVIITLPKYIND